MNDERQNAEKFAGEFAPLFLKLPPEHIVRLKFLLESYEGLGVLRTLNRRSGLVVVLALQDTFGDLERLIEEVTRELQLIRLPTPEGWDEKRMVDAYALDE